MLADDVRVIEEIFKSTELVISAHCEDETTVRNNLEHYKSIYGEDIPVKFHPLIRSEEACLLSSSKAVELAEKTGARLHVFHVSTAAETRLFRNDIPLSAKKITAEVCLHHLWFSDDDYAEKGTLIKWNPAIKTKNDRAALWEALKDDLFDIVATDHAPHTLDEKMRIYTQAPSGGPLVQHALPAILEKHLDGLIDLETIVTKMCHNPAILFDITDRGYIREGYFADLVIVNTNDPWIVSKENILYKCGWSPFEGSKFRSKISHTFINGHLAYENGKLSDKSSAMRLTFSRI